MKRLLLALICAASLAGTASGQTAANFGSRMGGLGNAGGFATGSGLSNGSTGSLNFGPSTGSAFGNTGGLPYGSNALYNWSGNAFHSGNAYLGSSNIGALNLTSPFAPSLGFGTNGLADGGMEALILRGMGSGGVGLYGEALGLGSGLPVVGLDAAGLSIGVPGLNYGVPGTGYGVPSPTLLDASSARVATGRRRTDNFANSAMQDRVDASAAEVPTVTANALRIQDRIARSVSRANFRNIKVLMSGRTVVLQGSVDSQADEQLVQRLISLEPGVDGVISQLNYPGNTQPTTVPAR